MSFVVSKLAGGLLAPATLLLLALVIAFLAWHRRPRLARALVGVSAFALVLIETTPIDLWIIEPLQLRFPPANELKLDRVDGIVLLGGAITNVDIPFNGLPSLDDPGERATAFFVLAQRYPSARLAFLGGGGGIPAPEGVAEADAARKLFTAMGMDQSRIVYERESRNTWENAQFGKALVQPKPGERWLLVTSAWHMPRAVGCFRQAGFAVDAYPVDYRTRGWGDALRFNGFSSDGLLQLDIAVKEWIGLMVYRLAGYTPDWLPGPEEPAPSGSASR